ncbi:MAG: hypothetical protein V1909_06810 [Candidatus Micrarchaeota archaeon]
MKKEFAIFFGILLLIGITLYAVDVSGALKPKPQPGPEREISVNEFASIIEKQDTVSLLMRIEPESYKNQAVIKCAIGLARSLGALGKKIKNYAFEANYCLKPDLSNVTQMECEGELAGSYFVEINYGVALPKFYEKKALVFTNENFTGECAIAVAGQAVNQTANSS